MSDREMFDLSYEEGMALIELLGHPHVAETPLRRGHWNHVDAFEVRLRQIFDEDYTQVEMGEDE